jgi:hypothetical protein
VAILLGPLRTGHFTLEVPTVWIAIITGVVLGAMMWSLGKALEKGPAGLTFATLNSATVVPGLVMMLFFGTLWGFQYSIWHAIGSAFVLAGLFWAATTLQHAARKPLWGSLVTIVFLLHVLLLTLLQWRALLLKEPVEECVLIPCRLFHESSQWFTPLVFLTATLIQMGIFRSTERRSFKRQELFLGSIGGVANGIAIYLLVVAPEIATPWQNAMIFPLFAVSVIILCNLWSQWLYREKINWLATGVCLLGIVVGTFNWSAL